MCFICKLSFGNTKSFGLHANSEHTLNLQDVEKTLLNQEYSSAIIQRNVDEKPQISFLEPLDMHKQQQHQQQQQSQQKQSTDDEKSSVVNASVTSNSATGGSSASSTSGSAVVSTALATAALAATAAKSNDLLNTGKNTNGGERSPQSNSTLANNTGISGILGQDSCPSSLAANSSNSKLLNDFLIQQQQSLCLHRDRTTPSLLASLQQQQQQLLQQQSGCPEHPTVKGVDCKTCEMLEVNFFANALCVTGGNSGIKSPMTPTKSPNSISNMTTSASPPGSTSLTMSPTSQPAPSFTIGACPDHVNGRPFGVDCAR